MNSNNQDSKSNLAKKGSIEKSNTSETKNQDIKEYWTQHRITLIAYEAQYIYNKKKYEEEVDEKKEKTENYKGSENEMIQSKQGESLQACQKSSATQKKASVSRKGRKKTDPKFETGFLFNPKSQRDGEGDSNQEDSSDQDSTPNIEELVKKHPNLNRIFHESKDADELELREFLKIMLELKNSDILPEFLRLYEMIILEVCKVRFEQVEKENDRGQLLRQIQKRLLDHIELKSYEFKIFNEDYLKNDRKETEKLILVETYCFLAERLNFNINEYYSEAFSVTLKSKENGKTGAKKVKV